MCKARFDRDKIQAVKTDARRYAHYKCFPEGELVPLPQVDDDLLKLEEYIMELFHEDFIGPRVRKQIKQYKEEYNYTYSGMLKSLIWFYEIKGNSVEKANNNIGIIPYIYNDACSYYYSLYLAKIANESKNISEYKPKVKEIEIQSPRTKIKPPKLFNI